MLFVKVEGRDSNIKKNFKNIVIKLNMFLFVFKYVWKRKKIILVLVVKKLFFSVKVNYVIII